MGREPPPADPDRGVSERPGPPRWSPPLPRSTLVRISLALVALALVGVLAFGLARLRRESGGEAGEEQGATPYRVTTEHGTRAVSLAPKALERAGLRTQPLAKASFRPTVRAYGTVVDLRGLLDLRDRYAAAKATAAAARARATASSKELKRLQGLFQGNRNVSATELESARATAEADRAEEQASAAPVSALAALARQDLGPVLAGWITDGSPELDRLLAGDDVLIQVTLPPDVVPETPPASATISVDAEPGITARFVSPAVRTDPRIQGLALYYVAPAHAGLLAERNVIALLALGPAVAGALVPRSAVVWQSGAAWVYVSSQPERFDRHELHTDRPVDDGYLVTDLAPGTRVVVRGAALLLSEEFRAEHPRRAAEEEDED